ncbi:MAG TPA: hypothetical protein PK771_00205 [Spirochaetota bacterium]|nr:hypothetical protein [Spirochaetota bacterium]
MKSFLFFIFILITLNIFSDVTGDIKEKIPEFLKSDKNKNNFFYNITNQTVLNINSNGNLMYNYPVDIFYPYNNLIIQANYFFPVNSSFLVGPSFFNDNYFKIFHDTDSLDTNSVNFIFNSVILGGISFKFTPIHKKLKVPFLLFMVDFGPALEINNNKVDGDDLKIKFGGFNSLAIFLPIMPANLFVFDVNIFSVMATDTPIGWFPGVMVRNILLLKFNFTNFINKKIGLGLKIKNHLNFTLTGKPDLYDLTSQYTYDRLELYLSYGGVKGLEINSGYGFEYITFARDSEYHIANKIVNEISYKKDFFKIVFNHSLSFFDGKFDYCLPVNKFELVMIFTNMEM